MTGATVRIGSRGSALALAQATLARDALAAVGISAAILLIETEGDRRASDTPWGEGAFVKAIERALLEGRVDAAVHSAKDIPTDEDPRLRIVAYLARADPRDALVVPPGSTHRRLRELPIGARVGTDSPRRTGFVLAIRPDLSVHPLHGNVDTRLRRLDDGETDALILACAGLDRLGRSDRIAERIGIDVIPPAPGQGAIAVQIRSEDAHTSRLIASIDHQPTRLAVEAEREVLRMAGGGCRAPIGAIATVRDGTMQLLAGTVDPDGGARVVSRGHGPVADGLDLGREMGRTFIRRGDPSADRPRVLVTRAAPQAGELLAALRAEGLEPVLVPSIEIEFGTDTDAADRVAADLPNRRWIVVTSANGARALLQAAVRLPTELSVPAWAALGDATRAVLERAGIEVDFMPSRSTSEALAAELPVRDGDRITVVRGDLADGRVAEVLRTRGAEVRDVVVYRTREAPEGARALLRRALEQGRLEAVVFTSGSTVRGLASLARVESIDLRAIPAVCIGEPTARAATAAGFVVRAVAPTPDASTVARTVASALILPIRELQGSR